MPGCWRNARGGSLNRVDPSWLVLDHLWSQDKYFCWKCGEIWNLELIATWSNCHLRNENNFCGNVNCNRNQKENNSLLWLFLPPRHPLEPPITKANGTKRNAVHRVTTVTEYRRVILRLRNYGFLTHFVTCSAFQPSLHWLNVPGPSGPGNQENVISWLENNR